MNFNIKKSCSFMFIKRCLYINNISKIYTYDIRYRIKYWIYISRQISESVATFQDDNEEYLLFWGEGRGFHSPACKSNFQTWLVEPEPSYPPLMMMVLLTTAQAWPVKGSGRLGRLLRSPDVMLYFITLAVGPWPLLQEAFWILFTYLMISIFLMSYL